MFERCSKHATSRGLQDAQRESEAAAERTQGGLKRKLDQIQERLELTIGERDKLSSDLTALQAALAKKVLEMNDAMHAATTNQQEEVSSLKSCHKRQTEENDTTHCRRIAALKVSCLTGGVVSLHWTTAKGLPSDAWKLGSSR